MGKLITLSFISLIVLLLVFQDQVTSSQARASTNKKFSSSSIGKRKSPVPRRPNFGKSAQNAKTSSRSNVKRGLNRREDLYDEEDEEDEEELERYSRNKGKRGLNRQKDSFEYSDYDDEEEDEDLMEDSFDEDYDDEEEEDYDDDYDEEEDDDYDEEEEEENYRDSRESRGRGHKGQKKGRDVHSGMSGRRGLEKGRGAMAPYGYQQQSSQGFRGRDPRSQGSYSQATSTSMFAMLDKAKAAVEDARSKANQMTRMAKGVVSSNYEKLLLDATAPDDEPVSQKHVGQLIGAITSFRRHGDFDSDRNPYRVTLRKIWNKIVERDYRTKVKALYLLHRIVRDSSPRDGYVFQTQLRRMRAEINPKAPPLHYFNLQQVCALNANGEIFEEFVENYGRFLFRRAYHFTSRAEEMKGLSVDADSHKVLSVQEALGLMSTASTILESGMKCELDEDTECVLLCSAMEVVLTDLKDIWKYYQQGIERLIGQDDAPSFGMKKVNEKELIRTLEGFIPLKMKITKYLKRNAKLLAQYRIRIPLDLGNKVDEELLKNKILQIKNPQAAIETTKPATTESTKSNSSDAPKSNSGNVSAKTSSSTTSSVSTPSLSGTKSNSSSVSKSSPKPSGKTVKKTTVNTVKKSNAKKPLK